MGLTLERKRPQFVKMEWKVAASLGEREERKKGEIYREGGGEERGEETLLFKLAIFPMFINHHGPGNMIKQIFMGLLIRTLKIKRNFTTMQLFLILYIGANYTRSWFNHSN